MVKKEKSGNPITDSDAKIIELNILVALADYCSNHKLRYYLAYGTLLGAVRHKGFIPWDNDIDIYMPRPDYNKFREIIKSQAVSGEIDILDFENCNTFPFLKAIDNRTVLTERFLVTENTLGLYVDIFPLDGLPSEEKKALVILNKAKKLSILFNLTTYRFNTGSCFIIRLLKNLFYPFSRMLPRKIICRKLDNLCSPYDYEECTMIGNVVWGYGTKEYMEKYWFEKNCELSFENSIFQAPGDWDKYLSAIYGDYMTLPPVEKRVVHYFDAKWK